MTNSVRTCTAVALGLLLLALTPSRTDAATCGFTTIAGLSFGTYDVFAAAPLDTAGSIAYTCTGVVPGDTVTIDLSIGGAPSFTPRQLQSGANRLDYNIYRDAARVSIWGNGTGGSVQYGPVVPAEGATVTLPTFARVPAGQDAAIGVYADTIVVTMNF